jgi:arylsulfatase
MREAIPFRKRRTRGHAPVQWGLLVPLSFALAFAHAPEARAEEKKPNILVIWGDDIGYWNVSAYNQGMMGYKTPNIDRIAKEGALFTDWYGQQSCTAGRACFITGQSGFRTGLLKVGLPGSAYRVRTRSFLNSSFAPERRIQDGNGPDTVHPRGTS